VDRPRSKQRKPRILSLAWTGRMMGRPLRSLCALLCQNFYTVVEGSPRGRSSNCDSSLEANPNWSGWNEPAPCSPGQPDRDAVAVEVPGMPQPHTRPHPSNQRRVLSKRTARAGTEKYVHPQSRPARDYGGGASHAKGPYVSTLYPCNPRHPRLITFAPFVPFALFCKEFLRSQQAKETKRP
jgi:hypothetical protein